MENLVDKNGKIDFGILPEPVTRINYLDYALRTPLGRLRSRLEKKMLFKQFSFIGINAPGFMAGAAVVDLRYATNGFFYVFDKESRALTETKATTLPRRAHISPFPEENKAFFKSSRLSINMDKETVRVECKQARLELNLEPENLSPLRICTRTGFRGWTYTRKVSPIPMSGSLIMNNNTRRLEPVSCLGITDWTAGYLRRETFWYWAAMAAITDTGQSVGFNFSCGVNETEATENIYWIDNRPVKVDTVSFVPGGDDSGEAWHIASSDGKVRLDFRPLGVRRESLNALLVASRFSQYVGLFSGSLMDEEGNRVRLDDCPGWTEEHFARW